MSDADALWVGDPMKDFSLPGVNDSNIVASRGAFPTDVRQEWGATICMGFVLFRATANRAAMRDFVTVMKAGLVVNLKDDQMAVRMKFFWRSLFRERNTSWYKHVRAC